MYIHGFEKRPLCDMTALLCVPFINAALSNLPIYFLSLLKSLSNSYEEGERDVQLTLCIQAAHDSVDVHEKKMSIKYLEKVRFINSMNFL